VSYFRIGSYGRFKPHLFQKEIFLKTWRNIRILSYILEDRKMTGTETETEESKIVLVLKTVLLAVLIGFIYWGTLMLFRTIIGSLSRLLR